MKTVLETYPPSQYPKLYTGSIEDNQTVQRKYRLSNRIVLTMGFSLLSAIIMWDYTTEGKISQMIPWAYFMVQMIPMMWLEMKECNYYKNMRKNNTSSKKAASITPRKLFDFLSPQIMITALSLMVVAIGLVFAWYGFTRKSITTFAIILVSNLFFAGAIYRNIYGTKQDPYLASDDRLKQIKATVTSLAYVSIGVSVFLGVQMLMKIYDLKYLNTAVMSIYCQLILWASVGNKLKKIRIEDIDFSVYKDTPKNQSQLIEEK
jgi:hypothetical protein